ncbi:MAG TPA: glycosyltransferase [Gaiellaceae bacterium]|nr:glycosyltransferase [Gaiellaceae bacterium]
MRRALVLAYHFPPVGGAGVQRNAKFVKYLRDFGYDPTVVTGPGRSNDRWAPQDEVLSRDLPHDVRVERFDGPEPAQSAARRRAERYLSYPGPWIRWVRSGMVEAAGRAGGNASIVYASLEPYEIAPAAAEVAKRLGVPWVADLQDPWALDEMLVYPSRAHRRIALAAMRRALRAADAVVMNTPEARHRVLERFPELNPQRVVSITNGYDAADFAAPAPATPDDGVFRIVHTGYLHTQLGLQHRRTRAIRRLLGGAMSGVDILTRSHVYLLQAVENLVKEDPDAAGRIEIHLAGVTSDADRAAAARSPFVHVHGYLPHDQTVELMRQADLLFLPMHKLDGGARVGIVPGKTYEYMASGRPILAAVPAGDVRDFLEAAGTASICDPDDVTAMRAIVSAHLQRKAAGVAGPELNADAVAQFERRRLTERLAHLFDEVLDGQR